ncbi:MAG: AraC family transcriptional regulator [Oscillospiraceae bacterium]|nr:AraC family transcriptional regulator [Oscillospiraceae bacterium]
MIYEKEWENPNYKFLSYKTEDLNWYIHFHESFEICYVTDGEINITIGNTDYFLKKGDSVIIFPHQLHKYETKDFSRLHIITFMSEIVPQFAEAYKNMLPKDSLFLSMDKYSAGLYPSNIFMQKGLIYSIMGSFTEGREFEEFSSNKEDRLLIKALKFIEKNYAGECSLKAAAEELSYGYYHLSRTFKRLMQMSYNEYLNRYRINRAVYLLSAGNKMRIQDIALSCGYESLCSFNRNFKDFTGVTPREMIARK